MSNEQHHDSAQSGHIVTEMATPPPPAVSKKLVVAFLLCALVLAVILAIVGILPRIHAEKKLVQDTNDSAVPQVLVIQPKAGAPTQEIVLPGNMQAYEDAPIYSRTDGYLKKWYVDIGGHVKKGQLLAEIESPEVDQQLLQGRADLATAQANLQLSQTTSARYTDLLKSDAVSQQDTDNAVSDTKAKLTMVNSAQANVNRLEQLQSFEKITAPFDGVITARNTDTGQLINQATRVRAAAPAWETVRRAAQRVTRASSFTLRRSILCVSSSTCLRFTRMTPNPPLSPISHWTSFLAASSAVSWFAVPMRLISRLAHCWSRST